MALRHEPGNIATPQRSPVSKKEAAFRTHLAVYLGVGLFLFTLNLLTNPFHLWFYWPLFFWGWCLVFHAVATYGADAPSRVPEVLRSLVPWVSDALPGSAPPTTRAVSPAPFAAEAFAAVHGRIERLKELAWHVPKGPIRERAARMHEKAEQIAAMMAANRAGAESVNEFEAGLLAPAESLLEQYVQAMDNSASHSNDSSRQREEHELPLLLARFDALADRLHSGDTAERPSTRQAPGIDPLAPPPAPLRSHP